jgi:hypothetical protein
MALAVVYDFTFIVPSSTTSPVSEQQNDSS